MHERIQISDISPPPFMPPPPPHQISAIKYQISLIRKNEISGF